MKTEDVTNKIDSSNKGIRLQPFFKTYKHAAEISHDGFRPPICGAVNGMWPSKQGLLSTRPTTSTGHKPKAWELIGMWFHSHLSLSSTLLTLLFQPKLKIINWDHNRNKEKKEQAKQFSIKHQHLLIILSVFYWLAPHIYVSFQTPTAPPNQPLMDDPIVFHD